MPDIQTDIQTEDQTGIQTETATPNPRLQCRHIHTDGHRCGSPALRHEDFCYYHHTTRKPVPKAEQDARQTRQARRAAFTLPRPEDRSSIQAAIGEILLRLAANELDPRRAGLLLYGLQIASLNLPPRQPAQDPADTVEEVIEHPDHGLIAPPLDFQTRVRKEKSLEQILMEDWARDEAREQREREQAAKLQQTGDSKPFILDNLNAAAGQVSLLPTPSSLLPASIRLTPSSPSPNPRVPHASQLHCDPRLPASVLGSLERGEWHVHPHPAILHPSPSTLSPASPQSAHSVTHPQRFPLTLPQSQADTRAHSAGSPNRMRIASLLLCLTLATPLLAQSKSEETAERALLHQSDEWKSVQAHLPNPKTASAAQLETAADILRARRFHYDAMDFYRYALDRIPDRISNQSPDRSGDVPRLLCRLGMVELELRHPLLARAYFLRAAALQPKNALVWNNIGASEFLAGDFRSALRDYNRAVKLEKRNAIYHSNLGTAYFEAKDYESARKQFQSAYKLDPNLYQRHDDSGVEAHIFSSTNHGRFCFELARVAARGHDDAGVVSWLTKASDSGFDIQTEMSTDRLLDPYRKDPRILLVIQNAKALRAGHTLASSTPIPALPDKLTPVP